MSIASNFYAAKVYSEHPLICWPLDDDISYLSLITETERDFDLWTKNCTSYEEVDYPGRVFPDSITTTLEGSTNMLEAVSQNLFNFQDLDASKKTFSINLQLITNSAPDYYEIGYEYTDPTTSNVVEVVTQHVDKTFGMWTRIGDEFVIPDINAQCRIIFRAYFIFISGGTYSVTVNGMGVGQWLEQSSIKSLGASTVSVPTSILGPSITGAEISPYGVPDKVGYFIQEDGSLLAINQGIPMVFGSDNVTRLSPSPTGKPSVIMPSEGMMHDSGKYNSYTLEFWMRIENNSKVAHRIWGPTYGDYGIYIKEGAISLVIGNQIKSHFVGEWYRPMLMHLIFTPTKAELYINDTLVISMDINVDSLDLSGTDWMGFYCYDDMLLFELDCVSISPYIMSNEVMKKRFVWGQGVMSQEKINSSYDGTTATIDYPYAKYTSNRIYPDVDNWSDGIGQNIVATAESLSVPEYKIPQMIRNGEPYAGFDQFYADNQALQDAGPSFIKMQPSATWTDAYSFSLPFNTLVDDIRSFYGIFSVSQNLAEKRPLMYLYNTQKNKVLEISINGLTVSYSLVSGSTVTELATKTVALNTPFVVGMDIAKSINAIGVSISEFFANPSLITMHIGGNGSVNFDGRIYRVGLLNNTSLSIIDPAFIDASGFYVPSNGEALIDEIVSYTLIPTTDFGRFYLDVGIYATWRDHYPLSFFASYTTDENGSVRYDMDFVQFNISSPTIYNPFGTWDYLAIQEYYESQTGEGTYNEATIDFRELYDIYGNITGNPSPFLGYDMSNSSSRYFITFQQLALGSGKKLSDFKYQRNMSQRSVLDANEFTYPLLTAFEVSDNTVIYPPNGYDAEELAMSIHIEIKVAGVNSYPFKLRRMALSSKTLPLDGFDEIGTRYAIPVYPYSKVGVYYSYSQKNPYLLFKESMPYLYLTKSSGIESVGRRSQTVDRGISMPINSQSVNNFKITSLQLWMKYTDTIFSETEKTLFEIDSAILDLDFNVVADASDQRGKIIARNQATGQEFKDLQFYQDGKLVLYPRLEKDKWTVIGIYFDKPISFSNFIGSLNLMQSAVFNNISYYIMNFQQELKSYSQRQWINIRGVAPAEKDWLYWRGQDPGPYRTWEEVARAGLAQQYGVTPRAIYETYTGTNVSVVDDNDGISLSNGGITLLTGIDWTEYTKKPV